MRLYDWKRRLVSIFEVISLTNLWNGSLGISSSVDFWYFLTSRRATVPDRNLGFFFLDCALFLTADGYGTPLLVVWRDSGSNEAIVLWFSPKEKSRALSSLPMSANLSGL